MTIPFITDQTVEINGTVLHYTLQGQGEPIVFIHAGVADSRGWQHQIEAFAQDYQVLAYDLRGFGQSKMPGNQAYAHHEDLYALLTHEDIQSANLVAMSMGGKTAINFALTYPEMVKKLIVIGSALEGYRLQGEYLETMWKRAGEAFDNEGHAPAAQIEMETWLVGPSRKLDDVSENVRNLVSEMIELSYIHEIAAEDAEETELTPPATERLSEIQAPTLVLIGEYDVPVMHDIATKLDAEIPNAKKILLKNTAHLPNVEIPDVLNQHIREFLTETVVV